MEKEKDMSPPPGFGERFYLHKNLLEENNLESCQHKIEVCKALVNLRRINDTDVDKYLDRVDHQDEFFKSIIAYRKVVFKNYQRAGINKDWEEFLKLSLRDLEFTIMLLKFEAIKVGKNGKKSNKATMLYNELVDKRCLAVSKHVHQFPNFHHEYNDAITNNSDIPKLPNIKIELEESGNLDSWGNILLDNLQKSCQLLGIKKVPLEDSEPVVNVIINNPVSESVVNLPNIKIEVS